MVRRLADLISPDADRRERDRRDQRRRDRGFRLMSCYLRLMVDVVVLEIKMYPTRWWRSAGS